MIFRVLFTFFLLLRNFSFASFLHPHRLSFSYFIKMISLLPTKAVEKKCDSRLQNFEHKKWDECKNKIFFFLINSSRLKLVNILIVIFLILGFFHTLIPCIGRVFLPLSRTRRANKFQKIFVHLISVFDWSCILIKPKHSTSSKIRVGEMDEIKTFIENSRDAINLPLKVIFERRRSRRLERVNCMINNRKLRV